MNGMLRLASLALALGVLAPATARATEVGYGRKFGLGLVLGDPTGLTAKWWLSTRNAMDFGLGFASYGWRGGCWRENGVLYCDRYSYGHTSFNADYLWQRNLARGAAELDFHVGVGGRIWFWDTRDYYEDEFALSARVPVGLDLMFPSPGFLEVFLELVPSIGVINLPFLYFDAALGARFYF